MQQKEKIFSGRSKRLAAVLMILVSVFICRAGEIGWSKKLTGTSIKNGAVAEVKDDLYDHMVANPTTWADTFFNWHVKNKVTLRFTDTAVANNYVAGIWGLSVPCTLQRWDASGASMGTVSFTLTLNISPGQSTQSQDMDVYQLSDTQAGFKSLLSVGTPTLTGTAATVPVDVLLENEIETERYYHFNQATEVPTLSVSSDAANNTTTFYWNSKEAAEEYELEWVHSSVFIQNHGTSTGVLEWKKADRIATGSLYYTIQNVFDSGYVYYRMRWIGKDTVGTDLRRVESRWSSVSTSTRFAVKNFDYKHHWSYSEGFAEHGKRSESAGFMDDLGRGRQSMGLVKSENVLLITEPFFDYEGRAVLQPMAAPDSAQIGKFGFVSGFTLEDGSGTVLKPKHFDTDDLFSSCGISSDVQLSASQGASRYYSSSNALKNYGLNAYLPDAQKYPYAHVRFNNEGQVASVSSPGADHALGSNKETKVYYASVSQEQLFTLFGNAAGYADHYRSKYVKDANGQVSGSYEDMSGKVLATFLSGKVPGNVDSLSDFPTSFDTLLIDMLQYDHFVEARNAFEMYNDIMITEDSTLQTLEFGVTPSVYEGLCDTINCHYNLTVEITENNCPVPALYTYTASISASALTHTVSVVFPRIGKYKVKKTLTLDQDSLVAALNYFIASYDSCHPFVSPPDTIDYGCNSDCPEGTDCNPFSPQNTSTCDDLLDKFRDDMTPGGQYFENQAEFVIITSYAALQTFYEDSCGGTASVASYDSLKANITDCLADHLATLHPEYCHYEWCTYEDDTCSNGESSRMFDYRITQYQTYGAADTAFDFAGNIGDEGQQVLNADPFFNCSRADTSLLTAMQDSVSPTSDLNKMWEKAVLIAACSGGSPCDDEWGVFLILYQNAKNRVIAAAKAAAGCNYLQDVSGGRSSATANGMEEAGNGSFVIQVPSPTIWDTMAQVPVYIPNFCPTVQCTTITLCDQFAYWTLDTAMSIEVQYTGSGGAISYDYTIADSAGFRDSITTADSIGIFLAAMVNSSVAPDSLVGVFPTFSATFDTSSQEFTLCVHGPNDLDTGTVSFTFHGMKYRNNCTHGGLTTTLNINLDYYPPDTAGCNPPPPHCFCSQMQNFIDAWTATYQDSLGGDTLPMLDTTAYSSVADYIATQLNATYGTSVSDTMVSIWLANCDSLGYPVADSLDPALDSVLDCSIPHDFDRCRAEGYAVVYNNSMQAWEQEKQQNIQKFIKDYTTACFDTATFGQRFYDKAPRRDYHFTLYYYDQADNLVRTVSPKAVSKIALDTSSGGNLEQMKAWLAGTGDTAYYPSHAYYYAAGTLPNGQTAQPDINLVTTYKYNSLNQVLSTTSPDADGISYFYYDTISRLVASQNPKQAAYSPRRYSYTLFDSLGRITEVGELETDSVLTDTMAKHKNTWNNFLSYAVNHYEVTRSYYDKNAPIVYNSNGFFADTCFLRNRVAAMTYERIKDSYDTTYDAASYYSYDTHGNAERVLKDVTELASLSQNLKQTVYDFDLISGNVNKVTYQPDQTDQFIHMYDYDDDNRLVREYTSHADIIYHNDEKQFYYLHGPAGRTEIGQHKVQGTDYMYTIQGWLKGVNGAVLNQHTEAGKDGRQESICISTYSATPQYITGSSNKNMHSRIASDAFGYVLGYYDSNTGGGHSAAEDYKPINTNSYSVLADINSQNITSRNLYNGNIKQMSVALMKPNSSSGVSGGNVAYPSLAMELITWQYEYDQLHRLANATALTGTTVSTYSALANNSEYKNTFTYDANGNILSQLRNGNTAHLNLDNLAYNYATNTSGGSTNRLSTLTESISSGHDADYTDDFNNGTTTVVTYDEIGNLKTDSTNHIIEIKWNVYGKVTEVNKDLTVHTVSDIEYRYNEMGLRTVKIVKPHHATLNQLKDQDEWTYTYYSYDAGGNVMAVYNRDYTTPATTYDDILKLSEHHIYASGRVGLMNYETTTNVAKNTYTYSSTGSDHIFVSTGSVTPTSYTLDVNNEKRTLGTRLYELKNHLGNVLVVVSDKKIPVFENVTTCASTVTYNNTFTHYTADVQSTSDYSPFGAPLPGRSFNSPDYRYGFNGQEKENDIYGDGNATSAEFWMYDARLGRRWNVDPIYKEWESPYATFANNPIALSDPSGLDAEAKSNSASGASSKADPNEGGGKTLSVKNVIESKKTDYVDKVYTGKEASALNSRSSSSNSNHEISEGSGEDEEIGSTANSSAEMAPLSGKFWRRLKWAMRKTFNTARSDYFANMYNRRYRRFKRRSGPVADQVDFARIHANDRWYQQYDKFGHQSGWHKVWQHPYVTTINPLPANVYQSPPRSANGVNTNTINENVGINAGFVIIDFQAFGAADRYQLVDPSNNAIIYDSQNAYSNQSSSGEIPFALANGGTTIRVVINPGGSTLPVQVQGVTNWNYTLHASPTPMKSSLSTTEQTDTQLKPTK